MLFIHGDRARRFLLVSSGCGFQLQGWGGEYWCFLANIVVLSTFVAAGITPFTVKADSIYFHFLNGCNCFRIQIVTAKGKESEARLNTLKDTRENINQVGSLEKKASLIIDLHWP